MQYAEIETFFKNYAAAFNRLDGDAVAALWASPSAIASGPELTWWETHAPMADNMRRLCEVYRGASLARCEFEIVQAIPMCADNAFALLRWTLTRADGSLLQRFGTGYNLQRSQGRIRVVFCTAFEESLQAMREGR